eukprot:12911468-Prorocentrum_lima.AAC.1
MVYVEDVITFGSVSMVKKIIDAFGEPWQCRATAIISRDGITTEEQVSTLAFLGVVVEVAKEKL